ncbi:IclR family transcriptional regulator [Cupriavidus gilardii]|uniref:IclR family transcriptional regulator n=1 Tax=Cupriavidus gilardii TaxID=82541 RepID=A0A849BP25_9BURK|nr:IclR family transcriptional regulator [Cupriavidus gilardii]QQE08446.1 IclR family transcriptional regulator [Cupriavidus sp. ISTL7]KAB0597623.1 IclR family transcriptional regulator [Cupriavidus gilardii]MCT9014644.1 IclR family transcriptional regulator [Cupriavidus gilardii]MCT9054364.1 IclR family transcriptional regulator [Cupriavidus gilardii]NNH12279.1 IclR family transcriptional regulator [Cupriavidus gilardii]
MLGRGGAGSHRRVAAFPIGNDLEEWMGRRRIDPAAASDPAADPRFVTALARGLELLRCYRPTDRWLAHQELARRTGLPSATVSRLTFTLSAAGYLKHRPSTGEYALAPGVLSLGFSMLTNFDIGRLARPYMEALAEHTQSAISLGVRHEASMVYVAHCRGTARLILGLDVGTRIPLAVTAMGRAMWSASTAGMREMISRRLRAAQPAEWPALLDGLKRAERQVAERGYTSSESEWEREIAAVGVAIDLGDGREPLALTVGGPSSRLHGTLLHDDFAPALMNTACAIVASIQAAEWED